MMNPETIKVVDVVLDCIKPITETWFQSHSSNGESGRDKTLVDGRTLLSLLLIAVCPADVLGEDYDTNSSMGGEAERSKTCARRLFKATNKLLTSLHDLSDILNSKKSVSSQSISFRNLSTSFTSSATLFDTWKQMDLETLLDGMRIQLEQSWVIYLSSSKTLSHLTQVTGMSSPSPTQDDPLSSLRLRHEASRAGSRSHIKRIRLSLDKLVGGEEAKEIVTRAKNVALMEIAETNCIEEMKMEVDAMLGRGGNEGADSMSPVATPRTVENESSCNDMSNPPVESQMTDILPPELTSNVQLVHRILLTDSRDFEKLSWDGSDAQMPDATVEEFMQLFLPQSARSQESQEPHTVMDVSVRVAQSMKLAFFNNIAMEMEQGNLDPIRGLMVELHDKMRSLLPNRQELHSHVDDDQVARVSSVSDVVRLLIRCGNLLSRYLESPARSHSTRELLQILERFNNQDSCERVVPFGIESDHLFAVASVGFILHKAELCQMDISNYKLACAAPLLHHVGHEYERRQFQQTFGEIESASVESLQTMLPATWTWMNETRELGESEGVTAQTCLEIKMDLVKSRGFVDGVLFTKSQLSLPELFALDVENISHIRNEARCCVIASALVLHACKTSKAPTSILSSDFIPEEVSLAKDELSSVLRKVHRQQDLLEASIIHATEDLAKALANRELETYERECLKNHVLAVLQGNDPVLKLLDNRVRSFFSFACKWKSGSNGPLTTAQPSMKAGQSILKGDETGIQNNGIPSTKIEFSLAAQKEATRLGFAFFKSELVDAGDTSRRIISLACRIYGDLLNRFLSVQGGD
jgi:hypothetical protein